MRKIQLRRYAFALLALLAAVAAAASLNAGDKEKTQFEGTGMPVSDEVLSLQPPKKDGPFAAVWIPYMAFNCGSEEIFEQDFTEKLEKAVKAGASAVFVHVRPFADSFYPSSYEPWSHILTGKQGQDPGYDPLDYMVAQTHKAGMEFHAWINPLRIATAKTPDKLCEESFYEQTREEHPYYFMEYNGALYYNPAEEEIRERIARAAAEIAEKYNVDGIHIDDYFYPTDDAEIDAASYNAYLECTEEPLSLDVWRTANIHALVASIYRRVKQVNPEARFGISPQGNIQNDLLMHADIYTWCAQHGYIDYICPQLYYPLDGGTVCFEDVLKNWGSVIKQDDIDLYIGLGVYKTETDADNGAWSVDTEDIERQIELCFENEADGIAYYEISSIGKEGVPEKLKAALVRSMA